jgi:hypothetical protein
VSLAETQRRLRELLAAPSGVAAALSLASPEERRACEALVRDAGGLSGLARLEVYANAYFARIRVVLADCFPVLAASLGGALFHDLVTAYLLSHPPRHFSIRRVGDELPDFLAREAGAEPFRRRAPAAADLAALERARLDAFDAADSPVEGRDALAALSPERWGGLRLRFAPSLRLLRLGWPVERLWAAHERGEPAPEIAPLDHAACVWRRDERVLHRSMDELEDACLAAAVAGASFGVLCERIAMQRGEGEAPALAAGLLAGWLDAGLVAGLATANEAGNEAE